MKNIFKLLFITLLLISCNKKKNLAEVNNPVKKQATENIISKIVFYQNNTSVPANFESHKFKQIEIVNDSAFLVEYTHKKGVLNETKTLKSFGLNKKQKDIFFSLPIDYLKEDEYFIGNPSLIIESKFKATITLRNNKNIVWRMSYNKKKNPIEIQPFYQLYFNIKQELYKTE